MKKTIIHVHRNVQEFDNLILGKIAFSTFRIKVC